MLKVLAGWLATALLLASNTTFADTRPLGDLDPGSASSVGYGFQLENLTYLNGSTYFATTNCRLWMTDGTMANTTLVADIGQGVSSFCKIDRVNNVLFLTMKELNPPYQVSLFTSDGTAAGTLPFTVPNIDLSVGVVVQKWLNRPGWLLLDVANGPGHRIWATDGTVAHTVKLATSDLEGNPGYAFPNRGRLAIGLQNGLWLANDPSAAATSVGTGLTNVGTDYQSMLSYRGNVYFTATDAAHGKELWVSDMTDPGTQLVKDFTTGPAGTTIALQAVAGPWLYFRIGDVMWRTDGTLANTIAVTVPGVVIAQDSAQAVGSLLLFSGQENDGFHLWRSDGSVAGTIDYGGLVSNQNFFSQLINFGSSLYYRLPSGSNNPLYRTDGSTNALVANATDGVVTMQGRSAVLGGKTQLGVVRDGYLPTITQLVAPNIDFSGLTLGVSGSDYYFDTHQATTGSEPYATDLTDTTASICSSPNLSIPDNSAAGAVDYIDIPQHTIINNLTVDLKVSHTYIGDLTFSLSHTETGRIIPLVAVSGSCVSNDLDVVWDDLAADALTNSTCSTSADGQAYPAGTHLRPAKQLTGFIGEDLHGQWVLRAVDHSPSDVGGISQWCLDTTGKSDVIFKNAFEIPGF